MMKIDNERKFSEKVNGEKQESENLLKVNEIDELSDQLVESPMSNLAFRFEISSSLATPKTTTTSKQMLDKRNETKDETDAPIKTDENNDDNAKDNQGLISNTFTINSAGISPATRQREQQSRAVQRRLNILPQIVNFDKKCDSPLKEGCGSSSSNNVGEEDISFYSTNSPSASPRHECASTLSPCHNNDDIGCLSPASSPSIFTIEKNAMQRSNSHDSTSMDSGFHGLHHQVSNNSLSNASTSAQESAFTFLKPKCPENTSPTSAQRTPSKFSLTSSGSSRMGNGFKVFHSLSSGSNESIDPDDEYMELMEMENMDDDDAQMPTDLSSLICKDIKNSRTPDHKRPTFVRKCLNMDGALNSPRNSLFSSPKTPKSSTITSLITTPERQCLATISENVPPFGIKNPSTGAFKRPEPPMISPIPGKRLKCENDSTPSVFLPFLQQPNQQSSKRPMLRKSVSMNDAAIMSALSRSSEESNLIGDFSRSYCLPLIDGKHSDLKSISSHTMRRLLDGDFNESVASYKIIDCRYPYEYQGGHIRGAVNLYTHEQIIDELVKTKTETPIVAADGQKRNILIFHCEFSSERGPKLSRFLRNHDRMSNPYPALHYPEIYLLHNGYKEFFEDNKDMCDPHSYRPMLDSDYSDEYRLFRAKSKSWGGDARGPGTNRFVKSRSRLVL